LLRQTTFPILT